MSLAGALMFLATLWPSHLAIGAARPPGEVPALDARSAASSSASPATT